MKRAFVLSSVNILSTFSTRRRSPGRWKAGDREALKKMVPVVYKELREIARHHLQQERPGHTLQSAPLVHEADLRVVDQEPVEAEFLGSNLPSGEQGRMF